MHIEQGILLKIEIITTPNIDLKESGFGTLKASQSILKAVKNMNQNVVLTICTTKEDLQLVVKRKPDLVILSVKYLSFEDEPDIWLSEFFEQNSINYTGSSKDILKFDSNKVEAKSYLKEKAIKTADFFTAIPEQYKSKEDLPIKFPLFLKPIDAANGNGIDDLSYVTNFKEYESKVLSLYEEFGDTILVEEYLNGKEYTVSVIEKNCGGLIVSPIEILPLVSTKGLKILGYKAKTDDSESLTFISDNIIKNRLIKMATDVFHGLKIRDFGRIDIKMDSVGVCHFMEVNLVPGMTYGSSYFPKSCEINNEFSYEDVVKLMLSKGLSRISSTKNEDTFSR